MFQQGGPGTRSKVGCGTTWDEGRVEVGRATNNASTTSTLQAPNIPVNNEANSQLHAPNGYNFPFAGQFQGGAFNCQSSYAYEKIDTINAVARIAQPLDFTILSETWETVERKATLDHRLISDHHYF